MKAHQIYNFFHVQAIYSGHIAAEQVHTHTHTHTRNTNGTLTRTFVLQAHNAAQVAFDCVLNFTVHRGLKTRNAIRTMLLQRGEGGGGKAFSQECTTHNASAPRFFSA